MSFWRTGNRDAEESAANPQILRQSGASPICQSRDVVAVGGATRASGSTSAALPEGIAAAIVPGKGNHADIRR